MKFIITVARILSAIFSPLLMGTYGIILAMWLSYLCYSPTRAKLIVIAVTFVATCAIPVIAIFLLNRLGVVKNPRLSDRADRTVPYIICTICYLALAFYYHFVNAPIWLSMLMLGGAGALIVLSIVNRWWKISGHATGMGAIVAIMFFLMCSGNSPLNLQTEFITSVIVAGMVCSSRLILNCHTLLQVGAGFVNGFVFTFLPAWLMQGSTIPAI